MRFRRFALALIYALAGFSGLAAQDNQPPVGLDVASIKPPPGVNAIGRVAPNRFYRSSSTLFMLVMDAYGVDSVQIRGGDAWTRDARYHVDAKAAFPATVDQMRVMVRGLLADRFKLRVHFETCELPRYALVTSRSDGRLGDRLRLSRVDCRTLTATRDYDRLRASTESGDRWLCTKVVRIDPGSVTMITHGYPMSDFARSLQTRAGRVVVDKTGLAGNYDIDLETEMPPIAQTDRQPAAPREGLSLFTALEEQLGLTLQSERGPVDILVIDHAEPPTPD